MSHEAFAALNLQTEEEKLRVLDTIVRHKGARQVVMAVTGEEYREDFLNRLCDHIASFSVFGLGGRA